MTSSDQHHQQPRKRKREELGSSLDTRMHQHHHHPQHGSAFGAALSSDTGTLLSPSSSLPLSHQSQRGVHHSSQQQQMAMHLTSQQHYASQQQQQKQQYLSTLSNHNQLSANSSPQQLNSTPNHNSTGSAPNDSPTSPPILQLTSGFVTPPKDKQPGGKKNKKPLPLHSMLIHWNNVPHSKLVQLQQQHASSLDAGRASSEESPVSVATPRMLACLTRRKEDPNHEFKIIESLSERPVDPSCGPVEEVSFNDLVIQHSSHNHGQALILLFRLVDANEHVIDEIPSSQFETITRRGIEKQKQKKNQVTKKQQLPVCTLTNVTPNAAPVGITTFVRIEGTKLALRAREQNCNVFFGDERATGIFLGQNLVAGRGYSNKSANGEDPEEDVILVTVPVTHPQGNSAITITFGDGTSANNSLGFAFYNVTGDSGANAYLRSLITGPQQLNVFANTAFPFGGMDSALASGTQGLSASGSVSNGYPANTTTHNPMYYSNGGSSYGEVSTPYSAVSYSNSMPPYGGLSSSNAPNGNTSMPTKQPNAQYYSQFYSATGMPGTSSAQQQQQGLELMDMFHPHKKNEPNPLAFQQQQHQMQQHLQQLQQHQTIPQLPMQPGMNGEP